MEVPTPDYLVQNFDHEHFNKEKDYFSYYSNDKYQISSELYDAIQKMDKPLITKLFDEGHKDHKDGYDLSEIIANWDPRFDGYVSENETRSNEELLLDILQFVDSKSPIDWEFQISYCNYFPLVIEYIIENHKVSLPNLFCLVWWVSENWTESKYIDKQERILRVTLPLIYPYDEKYAIAIGPFEEAEKERAKKLKEQDTKIINDILESSKQFALKKKAVTS